MPPSLPQLVVSALGGDGGKTLVSLGLIAALRSRGLRVAPFKKGPDYIDAAWLSLAAQRPARNLDTFLVDEQELIRGYCEHLGSADLALIEGNRGLYDGVDDQGTHSTAALSRLIGASVVLVLDATKVTRTLAAVALGCQKLEPETDIVAIVLNQVSTDRHVRVARGAIEDATGIPVIGAIRRARKTRKSENGSSSKGQKNGPLPGRHLGLVTPDEHRHAQAAISTAEEMISSSIDIERLLTLMSKRSRASGIRPRARAVQTQTTNHQSPLSIGVMRDSAFSFYYPENLEALESAGAQLVQISSMEKSALPDYLDGLYIGGGFPETHATKLADNTKLLSSIRTAAEDGLPIYAECGGLMLLARTLTWEGKTFPMADVLGIDVEVLSRPQGHGYCVMRVDSPNPFFEEGFIFRGHEFHYSTVIDPQNVATTFTVERGTGCFDKRDGLVYKNVLASYAHLHVLGVPEWSQGFIRKATQHRLTSKNQRHEKADI